MHINLAVIALVLQGAPAFGLGVNCRGSGFCSEGNGFNGVNGMSNSIHSIRDNAWANNGQQIACYANGGRSFCAFLQRTNGANMSWIKNLAQCIVDHHCGSMPSHTHSLKPK